MTLNSIKAVEQNFSNFLLDPSFVTKFNFYSTPNKSIENCRHFFVVSLDGIMRKIVFGLKISILTRKVIINRTLNCIIKTTPTNIR